MIKILNIKKSLYSTLYILNFLYICKYGGISKNEKLKQLLLRVITNGGALGFAHMFMYYYDLFFFNEYNDISNDDDLSTICIKKVYNDSRIHGLILELRILHPKRIDNFCKSKYSKWVYKQIEYNIIILYLHMCRLFQIYKIYDDISYEKIYEKQHKLLS